MSNYVYVCFSLNFTENLENNSIQNGKKKDFNKESKIVIVTYF